MAKQKLIISVAARGSALSRAQVKEVLQDWCDIDFAMTWVATTGDKDLYTSLRTLEKTDFFTREIDLLQLAGGCRLSIHSAKDLPEPLAKGLQVVAITKGVAPYDVLVFRDGENLGKLPLNSVIGTSSLRREEAIRRLRPDLVCVDIRGTIEARLALLDQKEGYPNNLKNWEFGKIGALNLGQALAGDEAAPVNTQARCSRDPKSGMPTQPKTNFSSCLGIQ